MKIILNIYKLYTFIINFFIVKYKKVEYSKLKINGILKIYGRGQISIGNNVRINSCRLSNPIGGQTRTIFNVSENAKLIIGDNCGFSNVAIVARKSIEIGNNVMIGGNTMIYDTDFHSLNYNIRIFNKDDIGKVNNVIIEDNVFIGAHCLILKGTRIGKNSIIGAGSVLAKSVPPNEIWAGNPAKKIRDLD